MIPIDSDADDADVMVDINTTPLVDVLLVLLVMLIITIPIQLHSVNLEMPSTNSPPPQVEPQIVQLDVTPAGDYMWNGETLAGRDELERVSAMPPRSPIRRRSTCVRPPRQVRSGRGGARDARNGWACRRSGSSARNNSRAESRYARRMQDAAAVC